MMANEAATEAIAVATARVATEVLSLEGSLRTTLRALAVCAIRASDQATFDTLAHRARTLAEMLAEAVHDLDDETAAEGSRRAAEHLVERLGDLERLHADRLMH